MYNRNDLTFSMFYESGIQPDTGNKVATLTAQVLDVNSVVVQHSRLQCVTDSQRKKKYSVGEQSIASGSDPLLCAEKGLYLDTIQLRLYTLPKITTVMKGGIYESEA